METHHTVGSFIKAVNKDTEDLFTKKGTSKLKPHCPLKRSFKRAYKLK